MAEPAQEPAPRQADVVAFFRDAPPAVIIEIVRRLPARSVFRLRAVCTVLREVTSHRTLLALLQLLQPPLPLLCFGHNACSSRYFQLRDYCVEALDLRSDTLRTIFRFTDNEYYDFIENVEGVDAPPFYAFSMNSINYYRAEEVGVHPRFMVHASIDGLLLVSFLNLWYVCNPATRQWAVLPDLELNIDCEVIGLYAHVSSGEYRVLYHTGQDDEEALTCYYVLTVGAQQARSIGCPISPESPVDVGLNCGLEPSSLSPPVQLQCNLHWPPQERQGYKILVFDTEAEVFSWKYAPNPIRNGRMQLLEMDQKLAMSVSKNGKPTLQLWRLDDYYNEIWSQIYRITIQVPLIPALHYEDWFPRVVSPEGDVLIECSNNKVLHCDRRGNLLHTFYFREETPLARHSLKETLLPHAIFLALKPEDAVQLPFLQDI